LDEDSRGQDSLDLLIFDKGIKSARSILGPAQLLVTLPRGRLGRQERIGCCRVPPLVS